jgi:hypothetical protein
MEMRAEEIQPLEVLVVEQLGENQLVPEQLGKVLMAELLLEA